MENFENINLDLTEKLAKLAESFLNFIRHFDSGTPAKSYTIEDRFGITSIEVRTLVRHLRRLGYPIGSGQQGYYIIHTREELEKTLTHLRQRKDSIERTILEMQRIQINKSIHQLNLNL